MQQTTYILCNMLSACGLLQVPARHVHVHAALRQVIQRVGKTRRQPNGCLLCRPWDCRMWLLYQHGDAHRSTVCTHIVSSFNGSALIDVLSSRGWVAEVYSRLQREHQYGLLCFTGCRCSISRIITSDMYSLRVRISSSK